MAKKAVAVPPPSKRSNKLSSSSPPLQSSFLLKSALLVAILAVLIYAYSSTASTPTSKATNTTPIKPPPQQSKKLTLSQVKQRAAKQPCKDRYTEDDFCLRNAANGGCEMGKGWMAVMCAASCARCDLLDPAIRCSEKNMGVTLENAVKPGQLNEMFMRLAKLPNVDVLHEGEPWVVLVKDFISEKESSTLLRLTRKNLKRSTDQGEIDADGFQTQVVSQYRTSSNSWCNNECEEHPVVVNLTERIATLVGIPSKNFEQFQVLQYEPTQKYDTHHDSNALDFQRVSGPRVLTFFMYLSDVEEGGETNFPDLKLKVKPRKGAAVLWPSVMSDFPDTKIQPLTMHAALPVKKGMKYGANSWIHLREYKTPNIWGCTGSFD